MKRFLLVLAGLCLLVFVVLCFRWPPGTDPYYIAWHVENNLFPNIHFLFYFLMGLIPLPILFLMRFVPVVLMFVFCLVGGLISNKLLSYYMPFFHGRTLGSSTILGGVSEWLGVAPGFLTGFLFFGFPLFIYKGAFFEEDLLGLILGFLAVFFVIDFYFTGKSRGGLLWCVLFLLVGVFVWRGLVFFFPFFWLLGFKRREFFWFSLPLLAGVIFLVLNPSVFPFPAFHVSEGWPGVLTMVYAWGFGVAGFKAAKCFPGFLRLLVVWFGLIGLYLARFQLVSVLPLGVGVFFLLFDWSVGVGVVREWRGLVFDRVRSFLNMFFLVGLFVGFGVLAFMVVPSESQMSCLGEVVGVAGGEEIVNEWRFGHWLLFLGGRPVFSPLSNWDYIGNSSVGWVLCGCGRVDCPVVLNCSSFCLFRC